MSPTRRDMLKYGTAMAAAGLGLARPGWASLELGAARLSTLSDGHLDLPRSFILGDAPQPEAEEILTQYGLGGDGALTPPCNVTLFRDDTRTVLFDVGSGPDFMPNAGALADSLDAVGVAPDDVTHVIFTHAHPDHLWGLLDDFDEPVFANASFMIGRDEWDYWYNPATVDSIGAERQAFAVGARRRLEAIENNVTFFDDGQEVLPGIAARASYGHTPGHMSFEIAVGGASAFVLGDAIGNPHLAFRRPDWPSGSDHDPDLGIKTRLGLLDQLASAQIPVIGFHLPGGGIGRVERADGAYRFVGAAQ